jgi:hypothetical protein
VLWIPSHLDKCVKKLKYPVPDAHFAVNHVADHFADVASHAVQLPMQYVSSVVYHAKLVSRIQRRLVRILITSLEKIKFDRRLPQPRPSSPSFEDLCGATRHNLVKTGNHLRCLDCCGSCSRTSINVTNWLKASCDPLPYDDSQSIAVVPRWYRVQIGNNIPHASHELLSLRGIIFCNVCGAFSSKKCRKLNAPCLTPISVYCARALKKLKAGELPAQYLQWPRLPKVGVMRPPIQCPRVAVVDNVRSAHTSHFDDPDYNFFDVEEE